jgi:tetratricopeptide (TPR) repeat protein
MISQLGAARLRPPVRVYLLVGLLAGVCSSPLAGQAFGDARELIRSGKYSEGIAALSRIPRSDTAWLRSQRELARALALVGRYDNAEATARQAAGAPGGRELWNTLGEVLRERGKRAAAESAFVRAGAEHASDSLTAALNLAILHYDGGDHTRASKEFDRFIDAYNTHAAALTAAELRAVAIACRYLGADNPQLFKDALKAFDRAAAADRDDLDTPIALGELFLEKYNSAEAQKTFAGVLAANPMHPRGLLGAAKRMLFDGEPGADSLLARALTVNPEYVAARVQRARGLLDIEDYAGAQREADRALAINPSSAEALAVAATIRYVQGDLRGYEALRQRALALNAHDAEFYATMADAAGRIRLYSTAAEFAKQGIEADARNWRSHGLVGMNQLRLGHVAEARKSLETAFKGDPYDVWIKNTLDLLDTFKNYDVTTSDKFQIMIEKEESALLSIYLTDLAERAYATFAGRYGFTPTPPVRIEVYRSHADFSVRTVGLAGLGALGVSFGNTLAFDSPAAKDAGPFNWGSTVWHELAHTFTLGLTENRVPRWLSEGLSVYEEHLARPGWGMQVTPDFLDAFTNGKLVAVSRMNDGFMRPAYPEQVQFSYYQASLVCDFIAREWGEKALVAMLQEYKAGRNTDEVFQKVLGAAPKAIDKRFDDYVRQRFAGPLAALAGDSLVAGLVRARVAPAQLAERAARSPGNFRLQLLAGSAVLQSGDTASAITLLERARALFPDDGEADGANGLLAHIYISRGDTRKAADALNALVTHNEADYGAALELARVLGLLGDKAKAADALDRAVYINPFDIAHHQRLADLYQALGDKARVVRERRAVVALAPTDRAEAMYRLALAWHDAGDDKQARTSVLRALEEAPNFMPAQELLLTIVDARKP